MRRVALTAGLLLGMTLPVLATSGDDLDRVYAMGQANQLAGLASGYSVTPDRRILDLNVKTTAVDQARTIAWESCRLLSTRVNESWTVRAFLIAGDRPAAVCTSH